MNTPWLLALVLLAGVVCGLAFLLVGALRALRALGWRCEALEVALAGRQALPPGARAPAFTLSRVQGGRLRLKACAGRPVLLVFMQSQAHPWKDLVAELNRIQRGGKLPVLLIETGGAEAAKQVAAVGQAAFPVLVQETFTVNVAKRYHVHALPFAFLIDEQGIIRARGVVSQPEHLDLLLAEARKQPANTTTRTPSSLDRFSPRPDDIFVVTYPRSGTTWMQMILYQLTTEGKMDFPHITTVSPWFERTLKDGKAYDALPAPRIFKSHLSYRKIPKGPCKYLYVARDGMDVAASYYHFHKTHMGYQGSWDEFFDRFLRGEVLYGSWFRHMRGWWEHRDDANVLFLRYEDLVADLPGCLRRLSDFCDLEIAPECWPGILERCSFGFMKRHESQFDPLMATVYERGFQPNQHLRQGRSGTGSAQLTPAQTRRFQKSFTRRLGEAALLSTPRPMGGSIAGATSAIRPSG
ncbi:MAG TPA: sulfotransferase domain-containing protein [Gemmataceae bacterium]|nr:sulfotransferase domain-containing protein [Gemmataceae bacterium]